MKYLLECRHTGHADISNLNGYMVCPVCHVHRKLLAVECREWHIKCDNCRFGKWHGQDKSGAVYAMNSHLPSSHVIHLDYQYRKETYDAIYKLFGRRIKKYIELKEWEQSPKMLSERFVQLTMKDEFVCTSCQVDDHGNCQGKCDCQHRGRIPF